MSALLAVLSAPVPATGGHGGSEGAPWFFWVIGPVAIVIGVITAARPDLVWRANRWQYKNRDALEPSRAGLISQRISGVVFAVFGIVFMVVAATK